MVVVDHAPQCRRLLVADEVTRVVNDRRRDIANAGGAKAVRIRVDVGVVVIAADVEERRRARRSGGGRDVVIRVGGKPAVEAEAGAQLILVAIGGRVARASLGVIRDGSSDSAS